MSYSIKKGLLLSKLKYKNFRIGVSFDFDWSVQYFIVIPTDDDQEGVMDNLLEALKTGSAFNVGREKRKENRRTPRASGGK